MPSEQPRNGDDRDSGEEQQNRNIKRRKLVGVTGCIITAGLAGCGGRRAVKVSLEGNSEYFSSVEYDQGLIFPRDFTNLIVNLRDDINPAAQGVILYYGDTEGNHGTVGTAESQTKISADQLLYETIDSDQTASLVAVHGGEVTNGKWVGGSILERVTLDVRETTP